jgi:cytochrome c
MVATYSIYGVCIMKSFAGRNCRAGLLPAAIVIAALLPLLGRAETAAPTKATLDTFWTVPEVGALPDDTYGRLVRQGRDLITATYAHIGPEVGDPAKRYAGNNLACGNCHLEPGRSASAWRSSASTTRFHATAPAKAPKSRSSSG